MHQMKDTLCYKLTMAFEQILDESKESFQEIGITRGNYAMMHFILENPGITQAELADMMHKDRNVVTKTIDKLEEKLYVQRVRGQKDRRSFSLFLTETGKQIIREYWPVIVGGEAERLRRIPEEHRQLFLQLLDMLID